LPSEAFNFILCFESLEHVERDDSMFLEMYSALRKNGLIFVSVPNEAMHSLAKNPHQFHYRHYIHDEFLKNFASNLELIDWYGQDVCEFNEDGTNKYKLLPDKDVVPRKGEHGQVNIYIFRKR
jgi:2-polyprenyl-3-methyl-5-hydroxy-6-metoxy-1,4-benzoquinol methylase